jgi:LuxR family transcriptional activator of conjugal transfer of Ti plasmids
VLDNKLLDSLEKVASAGGDEELTDAVGDYLGGFDIHMFTSLLAVRDESAVRINWLSNCERNWLTTYVDEGYQRLDYAVRRHVVEKDERSILVGRDFTEHHEDMTGAERQFYDEAAEVGLVSGMTLPRFTEAPGGVVATGFSFWTALGREGFSSMMRSHGREALLFLLAVEQKLLPPMLRNVMGYEPFTQRERDCLTHIARGRRADDIADRLCVSTPTVRLHLNSARRKLGAKTLPEAVAKALTAGMISA